MNQNILSIALLIISQSIPTFSQNAQSDEYQDFASGRSTNGEGWVQRITILSPAPRSEVRGNLKVEFLAPGMTTAHALCWQQPTAEFPAPFGHDAIVDPEIKLGADGRGSFVFPVDDFPNGPITVRILARNDSQERDGRELQLFNLGGVVWNQGIPKHDPPGAAGMKLVFSDDFDSDLSISRDGKNTRYTSHKPGGGDFSGWPFSDFEGPGNPFSRMGTFLRIHASKPADSSGSTGLVSSAAMDGSGFFASAPCYFECRFTAQSAPGTWPAFWTLTKSAVSAPGSPGDELDIVEAYGGVGKGHPNHPGYSITSHFWKQQGPDGTPVPNVNRSVDMMGIAGKSYWSTTFHTYAVKVTDEETTYYFDNVEVLTHPTGELSKSQPHFFMINYAIGGISGWKIDLTREGDASDMWVDYVRVYQGNRN